MHNTSLILLTYWRHQLGTRMKVAFNPLLLFFHISVASYSFAVFNIDCLIEILIIANPSVSDPVFAGKQSLERDGGCAARHCAGDFIRIQ